VNKEDNELKKNLAQIERLVSDEDEELESELKSTLRPKTFSEYIGQETLKEKMLISIEAAKKRNGTIDHILLYGSPGLGKTTLAGVIANEMGVNIKITSGPVLERSGDLAAILTSLEEQDILFIDEIHRLNTSVEEILYPAMEDQELDIIIGKGPSARSIRIELPNFTLIGATTRAGLLSSPLRDRFGVTHRMEYYTNEEIKTIILHGAKILGVKIEEDGAEILASRSRGTPRIANKLLKRVRDYCETRGNGVIDKETSINALGLLGIDERGLDDLDRSIITSIIDNYGGGPVGIGTLSLLLGEDKRTLEEVYEPFLVKIGYLKRTNRGRVVTEKAYRHFKRGYYGNLLCDLD
jgi:Holliday junction DNA helicase RuvB